MNRLVFCMFAEDVALLPDAMFTRMLEHARRRPEEFATLARDLFGAMSVGGRVGFETVEWFDGGLFEDDAALPMDKAQIETTLRSVRSWTGRALIPRSWARCSSGASTPTSARSSGAHYTDRDKIMRIIDPVIVRPLLAEWKTAKVRNCRAAWSVRAPRNHRLRLRGTADGRKNSLGAFLERLRNFTVLDPACGSGNFLYLALHALHDSGAPGAAGSRGHWGSSAPSLRSAPPT